MLIRTLSLSVFVVCLLGCSKEIPNLALNTSFGEETDLLTVMNDADHAVLVFMIAQRCPLSGLAADRIKEFHETDPLFTSFAGILIDGSLQQAQEIKEKQELPFDIFTLDRRSDPFAWNDLVRNVGSRRRQLIGGTIAVVDANLKVRYSADGEAIRQAPERLERLLGF